MPEANLYEEAIKGLVQSGPLALVLTVGVYFLAKRVFSMVDVLTVRLQQNEDYMRDKFSSTLDSNTRAIVEDTGVKRELIDSNHELSEAIRQIPCQLAQKTAAQAR